MLELGIPERRRKTPEFSLFPLRSFNGLARSIPASEKTCFQAKAFYLQFCSGAELSVAGGSRVIYLCWRCGRALAHSHIVGTFMNE